MCLDLVYDLEGLNSVDQVQCSESNTVTLKLLNFRFRIKSGLRMGWRDNILVMQKTRA